MKVACDQLVILYPPVGFAALCPSSSHVISQHLTSASSVTSIQKDLDMFTLDFWQKIANLGISVMLVQSTLV